MISCWGSSIGTKRSGSWQQWQERLQKFGLELHPEKTRLIEFGRYADGEPEAAWRGQTGDVRLSGLHAHLWEDSEGRPVHRASGRRSRSGLRAKLQAVKAGAAASAGMSRCRRSGQWLRSVVQGYFNYHAVPGNMDEPGAVPDPGDLALAVVRCGVGVSADRLTWERFCADWSIASFPSRESCIRIPACASTPNIQGRSRMR